MKSDNEVKNIAGHPDAIPDIHREWFLNGYRYYEQFEKSISLINSTEEKEWISVNDRLPEDNKDYQVWESGSLVPSVAHYLDKNYFIKNYEDENYMETGWYYSHGYVYDECLPETPLDVTHWMPLPKPPQNIQSPIN